MTLLHYAYLMPVLPLAGFVVLAAFGKRLGDPLAGWVGTGAVVASFGASCMTYAGLLRQGSAHRSYVQTFFTWIPVGGLQVKAAILVDPLSMTMALFVTGVSALIHLYSIGYMKGDGDFAKFFLYMNLFVTSMLLLVLGDNLLFTFVGWEGVGVCSYWLISFWFGRDSAAAAGKKAFLYNRLADVGFLVAVFLVFSKTGHIDYKGIFSHLSAIGPDARTAIVLLLFAAAVGKSAQIPLFPWLADAMEGPTPVSALIHAATMVTAGVYLMCRVNPLLALSHVSQLIVGSVGVATALVAALIACGQQDIKKVLAYSTVSQLGYMFLAVGTGAYQAAIFLMVAHAFFKAELFLGAGSVIHGLHAEQDLKRMGNLRRYMKLTFVTFLAGWLAIAGVPPLAGFWAKGDVLTNAYARYPVLWGLGLFTALLTAYYMSRLFALTFLGDDHWRHAKSAAHEGPSRAESSTAVPVATSDSPEDQGVATRKLVSSAGHSLVSPDVKLVDQGGPHEAPWVMALPLVLLAVLSLFGGIIDLPWHPRWGDALSWLAPVFGHALYSPVQTDATKWTLSIVDAVVALLGLAIALPLWSRRSDRPALEPPALRRALLIDDVYDFLIGRPSQLAARFSAAVVDNKVIDGAVNGTASFARLLGTGMRRVQTGFVRQYALGIVIGMVGLLAFMVARTWS